MQLRLAETGRVRVDVIDREHVVQLRLACHRLDTRIAPARVELEAEVQDPAVRGLLQVEKDCEHVHRGRPGGRRGEETQWVANPVPLGWLGCGSRSGSLVFSSSGLSWSVLRSPGSWFSFSSFDIHISWLFFVDL